MSSKSFQQNLILLLSYAGLLLFQIACSSGEKESKNHISGDPELIATGAVVFQQNCSSCHGFETDGIGPQLGGITESASAEWIKNFIKDSPSMIASGDKRAKELFERYQVYMPSFSYLTDEEIDQLIAYMHTKGAPALVNTVSNEAALTDPIPDTIPMSSMTLNLEFITQIPASSDKAPGTRIAKMDFPANTERMFIHDLRGKMFEIVDNLPVEYFNMEEHFPNFINQPGLATGFGSFAFHPEFTTNGLLYTTHTESAGSAKADFSYADSIPKHLQWVLYEWQTAAPDKKPFEGKGRELMRIDMTMQLHGVQDITFNPIARPGDEDYGLLYIGIGDGGCAEKGYPFLVHSRDKIWGTIIRIDPAGTNSRNGQYGIPKTNPFAEDKNVTTLKEIYALGFRNPHRITWTKAGQMLASNIGHSHIESLNLILPGLDFGWPVREGTFMLRPEQDLAKVYPLPSEDSTYGFSYPVVQYDHDEGNAICAGYEYWGDEVSSMKGKFFFGDIPRGKLFYVETKDLKSGEIAPIKEWQVAFEGKTVELSELCGDKRVDLRFGRDASGELYLFTKPDGKIYKLTNQPR